jgi:hypothetical protein
MKTSKKLILICLIGFIATACSTTLTKKDAESESNIANVNENNFQKLQQLKMGARNEK